MCSCIVLLLILGSRRLHLMASGISLLHFEKAARSISSTNQPPSRSQIDLCLNPALFCVRDPRHVSTQPLKVISIPKSDRRFCTIYNSNFAEQNRSARDVISPLGSCIAQSGPLSYQKNIRQPCLLKRYLTFLIFSTAGALTLSAEADQTAAALMPLFVLILTCTCLSL